MYPFGYLGSGASYATLLASASNKILEKLQRVVLGGLIYVFIKDISFVSIQYNVKACLRLKEDNDRAYSVFDLIDVCKISNMLIFVVKVKKIVVEVVCLHHYYYL